MDHRLIYLGNVKTEKCVYAYSQRHLLALSLRSSPDQGNQTHDHFD
jgi:hypothetical protein